MGVKTTSVHESHTLDEYVIEYGEDFLLRDQILSPQRHVEVMRYFPGIILVCI